MNRRHAVLVLAAATVLAAACLPPAGLGFGDIPRLVGSRRVLFIGNSHTYQNDLPGMLVALARASGDTALRAAAVAYPNFALQDHFLQEDATKALTRSNWEFVVLQQGTSALPESQVDLIFWAERFDPVIRAAGAEPVMYQIWPLASQRYNADASLTSYYNAAAAIGAIHAPAGDAFTAALDSAPGIGVYHFDGLHASHRGTYLAALVILTRLGGAEPLTLPPTIPGFAEDTAIVRLLQRAATEALSRTEARPTTPR
jgi:hypothetical protein